MADGDVSSEGEAASLAAVEYRRCYGCSCRKHPRMFRYSDVDYCVSCEEDDMNGEGPGGDEEPED